MKKHLIGIVFLIAVILLTFFISTSGFKPIDSLMRPPKNEGQNKEIQTAFEESINDKYILKTPISGKYRSSFILIDLDADKDDEVIVFYSSSSAPDVARMNVLDNFDGRWQSIADLETAHKQINCVDFSNLDGDKTKEIIVGWSIIGTEIANTLDIYEVCKNKDSQYIECIFESSYNEFSIADIESDGKNDILIFSKVQGENDGIKATYYTFADNAAKEAQSFFLDPIITSILSVNSDKDKKTGTLRFFLDGYCADSGVTTDIFYWNNNSKAFERPLFDDLMSVSTAAKRSTNILCKDINGDETIEIPFEKYIESSGLIDNTRSSSKKQSVICWMKYDSRGFTAVYHELFNSAGNYSLRIKNDWIGSLAVKNEPEKGVLTFYDIRKPEKGFYPDFTFGNDTDDSDKNNELFSILAIAENESNFYDLSGYKYIRTENGFSYFCKIYDSGKRNGITKESIRKILVT